MATTTATVIINSTDLVTNELSLSTSATLTKAGNATGLESTSGLARTNFLSTDPASRSKVIYRAEDASTNGSNKVYLQNLSVIPDEWFTVFIDQEEMGRLYAGDWAFFPWSATQGTPETFAVTIAGSWAIGDTWDFDGVTTTAETVTEASIAIQIDNQHYPNWTTSISGAVVTFIARSGGGPIVITGDTAITGDTLVTTDSGTAAISGGTAGAGSRSEADIVVLPSVATTMDLEHMLFKQ